MQRNRTIKQFFRALVLLSTGVAIGSGAAFGFGVLGPSNDLEDAVRWSNVPGSLVEQGVRGLGGGIEYAVAEDFCANTAPFFLDEPKPSCEQVMALIQKAFDKWAAGHPILKFTNVTGKIKPELPPAGRDPSRGFGAEIDLLVVQLPNCFGSACGGTTWRCNAAPIGTNGKALPGHTITSGDINLQPGYCYFINPALAGGRFPGRVGRCRHLESLLLHEIGHILGLAHPHQAAMRNQNYDTDDDPLNEIVIDCEDPMKGLKPSAKFNPDAVMSYSEKPVNNELTNDDIGGRNFLYPICPSASHGEIDRTPPAAPLSVDGEGPGARSVRLAPVRATERSAL